MNKKQTPKQIRTNFNRMNPLNQQLKLFKIYNEQGKEAHDEFVKIIMGEV